MNKALLKQAIDDWTQFFSEARDSLTSRANVPELPSFDVALAITGLRRSGKTHLAFQISKQLKLEKILYFNFEDPAFYPNGTVHDIDLLISTASEFRNQKIELLILDEIQVVDGWERWLRKLIDQKRFRIIVTGSSQKLLSSELASSLTGRAIEHAVWPLSFLEYSDFKKSSTEKTNSKKAEDKIRNFSQYLKWGGLPEVSKIKEKGKERLLKQYLSDLMLKDVISRNQVRNKRAIDQILTYYLTNISSLHSYSALAKAFELDTSTAADYSQMLKEAFLIHEVSRYHHNLKVQTRDSRKVYITDLGFRQVGARSISEDTGKLLENLVYIELRRRDKGIFYFKEKQEVDFIVVDKYKPKEAIQVCASDLRDEKTWTREISASKEAAKSLGLKECLIVSDNREENLKEEGIKIKIIPALKWFSKT